MITTLIAIFVLLPRLLVRLLALVAAGGGEEDALEVDGLVVALEFEMSDAEPESNVVSAESEVRLQVIWELLV